ncbi:MAG: hypothetical protein OEY59_12720 [Deltaproteobacteria bacterium]|nr:hypothetical protein [Deltaproteobacteria bacterium]
MSDTESVESLKAGEVEKVLSKEELADQAIDDIKREREQLTEEQFALVQYILSKETFIDPLTADDITKAYAVYDRNPQKIIDVVIVGFQKYCRKCIKESALLKFKNEISNATLEDADILKTKVTNEIYEKVRSDLILQHLLVMLIFKNYYWNWIRYGLKEIFAEQRSQVGHELNSHLNYRYHTMKKTKNFKTVADLVIHDITEIVNNFKSEIMQKKVQIFD